MGEILAGPTRAEGRRVISKKERRVSEMSRSVVAVSGKHRARPGTEGKEGR